MPSREQEYTIYTDESEASGKFYGNFYGGIILPTSKTEEVSSALAECINRLGITSEVKWTKTNADLADRYAQFIDLLFNFVRAESLKIRIMFTQNMNIPTSLTPQQHQERFEILYYQFIKHAFGLEHAGINAGIKCRLYLDQLPSNREQVEKFKSYLVALNSNPQWRSSSVRLMKDQIVEIDSSKHVIAQALDVVLGCMHFRLNDKHKEKSQGNRRGKRTIVKEKLYKHIHKHICEIRPRFNIGISTGTDGDIANRWHHPYRHWLFVPSDRERNTALGKQKKTP